MLVNTARFGQLEIAEEELLTFSEGIPGFPEMKKFILLEYQPGSPFRFLQSGEEPNLTFVLADPFFFFADYEFDLPEEAILNLELKDPREAEVWVLVVVPENPKEMTANLQGPVIINREASLGQQIILTGDRFSTRHLLLPSTEAQAGARG